MTSDLVKRLNFMGNGHGRDLYDVGDYWSVVLEAADALEAAEAKLAKAREAIKLLIAHAKTSDAREGHTRCREVDMATAILKEIGHD